MSEIKNTPEIKNLAKEYTEECPYLPDASFKELLERASIEHKAVLDYLKDK